MEQMGEYISLGTSERKADLTTHTYYYYHHRHKMKSEIRGGGGGGVGGVLGGYFKWVRHF